MKKEPLIFTLQADPSGLECIFVSPTAEKIETGSACILIGGDICPAHRLEKPFCETPVDLFKHFAKPFSRQDLIIGNLECPLTNRGEPIPKTGPHLKARTECAKGLKALGFDVVTLANNHMMDMGEAGLRDTLTACHGAGLMTAGASLSWAEIIKPLVIERNGLKIAIVALTENEFSTASPGNGIGCNPLNLPGNVRQIQAARIEADFVIMILHGGSEMYPLPSPQFADTCRFFIEMGADAVVCHHTHVTSGLEYYHDKPIIYGLGNFLFDWLSRQPDDWYQGMAVELILEKYAPIKTRIFGFEQCREELGIRTFDNQEIDLFRDRIEKLSTIIANPDLLETEWAAFSQGRELSYVIESFGLNRIETFLYKKNIMPFWRVNEQKRLCLLNLIRCESHRDVLINALSEKKIYDSFTKERK
ncbi:MAG: CapA family protein [Proteobacteria bacterium]|nr:CapA family protein [Pseudomonadota bacterium]